MADRFIPEHRRTNYKAKGTFKPDELRRRREEQAVEIRKAKREENLAKRRGIGSGESRPGASLGAAPDSDDETAPTESQVCFYFFHSFLPPRLFPVLLINLIRFIFIYCSILPFSHGDLGRKLPALFKLMWRVSFSYAMISRPFTKLSY